MFVVDGEVGVPFWSAVEFCVPDFSVGLMRSQAHGVATWFSGGVLPKRRVSEAVVKTCVAENAEGEGGEEAGFLLFVLLVS